MLEATHKSIKKAAKQLDLTATEIEDLLEVDAAHEFEIILDSGKKYRGFRMQHSNKRGPYKGGIRFHNEVNFDEVRALATLMSLKTALLSIPLGGGKGGVEVNPKELTIEEIEEISRKYVRSLQEHIGPDKDVPAPDVNTNAQIMDWMVDEYSKLTGDTTRGSFTGKSLDKGGSEGRPEATGRGGLYTIERILELNGDSEAKTYAVQGFGNVGAFFAELVAEKFPDWKLIAVTDSSGGLVCEDGLDPVELSKYKSERKKFVDFDKKSVKHIGNDDILSVEVDILVFAALGGVVSTDNYEKINSKYVLELANGPIDAEASEQLADVGVKVVPDILANAGGVVVSYFEWKQNMTGETWSLEKVNSELRKLIRDATTRVVERSKSDEISYKDAAFVNAIESLTKS